MTTQISPSTCLIEKLTDELKSLSSSELSSTLVLLPTRRLELHLATSLVQVSGGSSLLPEMKSWDQFLDELLLVFNQKQLVMVSSQTEILLKDFISQKNELKFIKPDHSHELLHLLKELWRQGSRSTALSNMTLWLTRQWYISDEAKEDLLQKIDSIFAFLDAFESHLETGLHSLPDKTKALGLLYLENNLSTALNYLPYKRILVAGLTSLPQSEIQFLKQLFLSQFETTDRPIKIESWLNAPWTGLPNHTPLVKLNLAMTKDADLPLWNELPPPSWNVKSIHSCAHPSEEMATALQLATNYHQAGVAKHRILIAVPDEGIYQQSARTLASLAELTVNIPLGQSFENTVPGVWLKNLNDWFKDQSTVDFISLLKNPITNDLLSDFDEKLSRISLTDTLQIESLLETLPSKIIQFSDLLFAIEHFSKNAHRYLESFFKAFTTSLSPGMKGSLKDHLMWFEHLILGIAQQNLNDSSLDFKQTSAWKILFDSIELLKKTSSIHSNAAIHRNQFFDSLLTIANQSVVRDIGEPLSGFQIISLTEARYVPCDVLIIVGCAEGLFPHSLPKDSLIDNHLLTAAGMTGWQELEALEDTTFNLLVSRVPTVEVTFPRMLASKVMTKSRWLEILHSNGVKLEYHEQNNLLKFYKKSSSKGLSTVSKTPEDVQEGVIKHVDSYLQSFSASSLKSLMACPYQFLLNSLKLKNFEPKKDDDPRDIGTVTHKVIEYALNPEKDSRVPSEITISNHDKTWSKIEFLELMKKRLYHYSNQFIPKSMKDNPFVIELLCAGWSSLAEFWGELYEQGWNPLDAKVETKFGSLDQPITLMIGSRKVTISGVIDFVYLSKNNQWNICDFKTRTPPAAYEVKRGDEPQLLLYSMCLSKIFGRPIDIDCGTIGYWSLGDRNYSSVGQGSAFDSELLQVFGKTSHLLPDLVANLETQWDQRMSAVAKEKRFFADPKSCNFCKYDNVCRKNDPVHENRIEKQSLLSRPGESL